jgi:hypothetical protein
MRHAPVAFMPPSAGKPATGRQTLGATVDLLASMRLSAR